MLHGFWHCHRPLPTQPPRLRRRLLLPPSPFFQSPPSSSTSSISHAHHHPANPATQVHHTNTSLDSSSASDILLQQCTAPRQTKQIHSQIVLSGALHRSAFLSARLISVYSRLGLLGDARSVFLAVRDLDNSLLWNSILRANLSHGHPREALALYCRMKELGVAADGFTFPLITKACASAGHPGLCRVVHSHAIVMGYQFHLHVANELITMYGNIGRMDLAQHVFEKMPLRNVVSWNTLISGFALGYDSRAALDVFRQMEFKGPEPNPVTWTSLLSAHARSGQNDKVLQLFDESRTRGTWTTPEAASVVLSVCADLGALDEGKNIHSFVIQSGFECYVFVRNSLICFYGKLGNTEDAEMLFTETEVKTLVSWNALISCYAAVGLCDKAYEIFSQLEKTPELKPNVVSWSAVVGGFASSGMVEQSLELFHRMQEAGVRPNVVTVATVLSACAELAALSLGRELHGHIIRGLVDNNLLLGNGLIHMYAKCGDLRYGRLVFNRIEDKDLISWNSMISGYGINGSGEEALATFDDMVKAGFDPDEITFVAVLSACSHAGHVSKGRCLFDQMIHRFKLSPRMEHYACMVDLLGRAGLLEEACKLVEKMPMKPNVCVLGALLNSCQIHRNTVMAEEAASQIFAFESEAAGSYMLLSNIYAACGRWEDSARVRVLAKVKGLKKRPGQSCIELRKRVYVFSAGNTLPPEMEEVYGVLEELNQIMESEKYFVL